jgi:hypothetical protein
MKNTNEMNWQIYKRKINEKMAEKYIKKWIKIPTAK